MKLIQTTNNNIGSVDVGSNLPIGTITRRRDPQRNCCATFSVTNSGADTLGLHDQGYYSVSYNASLTAGAAGDVSVTMVANANAVTAANLYTATATAAAAGDVVNVTIPSFIVRAFRNSDTCPCNLPLELTFVLGGVAIKSGTSNLSVVQQ